MPEFDHVKSALIFTQDSVGLRGRDADGWVHRGDVSYEDPAITERLQTFAADAGPVTLVLPDEQVLYLDLPDATDADAARAEAATRTPYAADDLAFDVQPRDKGYQVAVVAHRTLEEARSFAEHHGIAFNAIAADGTKTKFGAAAWFWTDTPEPAATVDAPASAAVAEPVAPAKAEHSADGLAPKVAAPVPSTGFPPLTAIKAVPLVDKAAPHKVPTVSPAPQPAPKAPTAAPAAKAEPSPSPAKAAETAPLVVRHTDRPTLTPRSRAVQERAAASRDNPDAPPPRKPREPARKRGALVYMVVALALAIVLALWLFPEGAPNVPTVIEPQVEAPQTQAPQTQTPRVTPPDVPAAEPEVTPGRVTRLTVPIGTPPTEVAETPAAPEPEPAPALTPIAEEDPSVAEVDAPPAEEPVEAPEAEAPAAAPPVLERSPRPRNRPARRAPAAVSPADTTSQSPQAANRPATLEAVPPTPADPVPYERARIEALADDRPAARPASPVAAPTRAPEAAPATQPAPSASPPPRPSAPPTRPPDDTAPVASQPPAASPRPSRRPSAQLTPRDAPARQLAHALRAPLYAPGLARLVTPGRSNFRPQGATARPSPVQPEPRTAMLRMHGASGDTASDAEGLTRLYRTQARPTNRPSADRAPSGVDNSVDAAIGAALGRSGRPATRAAPMSDTLVSETKPAAGQNATGGLLRSARPTRRAGARPSGAGNPSTVGLAAEIADQAVENAIAAAVSSSTATPGAVPLTALQSSNTPPRRQAAPQTPAVAAPDPAAERAAARADQLRLDEQLQAQAEARARASAAADARREAQARAVAEARARAKAAAEEKAASASTYRPAEVDNEPELGTVKIPATAGRAAGSATAKGAMDVRKTQLIGVVGAGKSSRGLIRLRSGKIVTVRLGDKIDGGVINDIGNGHVQYVKRGKAYQLRILNER